ncbi:MAG: hypothetical protein WC197_05375 [Candidatus Gastranaerophilaceae bacterium]|jgi:hypothetical protein
MSFEIGGFSDHNIKVEGTVPSRDGGGGNAGYFQTKHQKEEEHEKKEEHDVFELSNGQNEIDEFAIDLKDIKIIEIIANFLNKILNNFFSIFNIKIDFNHK